VREGKGKNWKREGACGVLLFVLFPSSFLFFLDKFSCVHCNECGGVKTSVEKV
jgi:hypothetical protein